MIMNRQAREEWDKKQAEAEKLRKLNEVSTVCILYMMNAVHKLSIMHKFKNAAFRNIPARMDLYSHPCLFFFWGVYPSFC